MSGTCLVSDVGIRTLVKKCHDQLRSPTHGRNKQRRCHVLHCMKYCMNAHEGSQPSLSAAGSKQSVRTSQHRGTDQQIDSQPACIAAVNHITSTSHTITISGQRMLIIPCIMPEAIRIMAPGGFCAISSIRTAKVCLAVTPLTRFLGGMVALSVSVVCSAEVCVWCPAGCP